MNFLFASLLAVGGFLLVILANVIYYSNRFPQPGRCAELILMVGAIVGMMFVGIRSGFLRVASWKELALQPWVWGVAAVGWFGLSLSWSPLPWQGAMPWGITALGFLLAMGIMMAPRKHLSTLLWASGLFGVFLLIIAVGSAWRIQTIVQIDGKAPNPSLQGFFYPWGVLALGAVFVAGILALLRRQVPLLLIGGATCALLFLIIGVVSADRLNKERSESELRVKDGRSPIPQVVQVTDWIAPFESVPDLPPNQQISETTLGMQLGLYTESPFGLSNYNLPPALPLLPVLVLPLVMLWRSWRSGSLFRQEGGSTLSLGLVGSAVLGAIAVVCIIVLARVEHKDIHKYINIGHNLYVAWLGLIALVGTCAILLIPWGIVRWPLLIIMVLVPIVIQALVVWKLDMPELAYKDSKGAEHILMPIKPSVVFRMGLWRADVEAIAASPIIGHGMGCPTEILPAMPHYNLAWGASPSFPEHPHHEPLRIWIEGGIIGFLLVAGCLAMTILHLWRNRQDVEARLLIGMWAITVILSLIESHLSQPGPILGLAILTGLSWIYAVPGKREKGVELKNPATLGGYVAIGAAMLLLISSFFVTIASMRSQQERQGPSGVDVALTFGNIERRFEGRDLTLDKLIERVGLLDELLFQRATCYDNRREAMDMALRQGERLPIHTHNLAFLVDLAAKHRWDAEKRERMAAIATAAKKWADTPILKKIRDETGRVSERLQRTHMLADQLIELSKKP